MFINFEFFAKLLNLCYKLITIMLNYMIKIILLYIMNDYFVFIWHKKARIAILIVVRAAVRV